MYPVRITKDELTYDGKLRPLWIARGWSLLKNGPKFYRTKMLCRECIAEQETTQAMRRDYQKACRAIQGKDDLTYAQILAQQ